MPSLAYIGRTSKKSKMKNFFGEKFLDIVSRLENFSLLDLVFCLGRGLDSKLHEGRDCVDLVTFHMSIA